MEIKTYDKFAALPTSAQTLARHYREINPFVCDIWLQKFEKYLIGRNERALYTVAMCGGECAMLLPLLLCRTSKLSVLKIRSMTNFYTTVYSPLISEVISSAELASLIANYFLVTYPNAVIFEFEPLRDNNFLQLMAKEYAKDGNAICREYHKHINRYEAVLGDDFDSYLSRRPSKLKNTIRRKNKLLIKETASVLNIYSTAQDVAQHYAAFRLIYEESWKGEESYPEFIDEVLQHLAEAGEAILAILVVDEEPAAAQIWFKIGEAWGVFKLAYRPKYKRYSVGTLLTAAVIEYVLAERDVTEIDFFSGDDSYKADWAQLRRDHNGIELVNNRTFIGKALSLKRRFSG